MKLFDYQEEAVKRVIDSFKESDRATIVMACGTGKTLVGVCAARHMNAKKIVVLVPSLALVKQTLETWKSVFGVLDYLVVCSDKTIDDREDIKGITTSKEDAQNFINGTHLIPRVIFTTYQSGEVIAGTEFDLGIYDEAHKTASGEDALFGYTLTNDHVKIEKRLFMTATPKHNRAKTQDVVYSMDDEKLYGKIVYTLSFRDAIERSLISDYKILVSVVKENELDKDQRLTHAPYLMAIKKAIDEYGAKRIFTFHNTVKQAQLFADEAKSYFEGMYISHINGEMNSLEREKIMKRFEDEGGIISNARCLTEGVNVPLVDMIVYISPKKSVIDIVQSIGRAMRKAQGKKFGYVLLPIFAKDGEAIENQLEATQFEVVWDVLQAMKEQDHVLAESLYTGTFTNHEEGIERLKKNVVFSGEVDFKELEKNIFIKSADVLFGSWDRSFEEYKKDPVSKHEWARKQRKLRRYNQLSKSRIEKLESIGFEWEPRDDRFKEWLKELEEYKKERGDCNVSDKTGKYKRLTKWVHYMRNQIQSNQLSEDYKLQLLKVGFIVNVPDYLWFTQLDGYMSEKKHSQKSKAWAALQRKYYTDGTLEKDRIAYANKKGFVWDPLENAWNDRFKKFVENKPKEKRENQQWIWNQKRKYQEGKLPTEQIEKLKSIGALSD